MLSLFCSAMLATIARETHHARIRRRRAADVGRRAVAAVLGQTIPSPTSPAETAAFRAVMVVMVGAVTFLAVKIAVGIAMP